MPRGFYVRERTLLFKRGYSFYKKGCLSFERHARGKWKTYQFLFEVAVSKRGFEGGGVVPSEAMNACESVLAFLSSF